MNLQDIIADLEYLLDDIETNEYYLTVEKLHKYLDELLDKLHKVETSTINNLAKKQYELIEKLVPHWHTKTVLECLALIASEVGEAVNEARGEELTDNFKYELVDILLRVFDLAHQHNIDLDTAIKEKMEANKNRDFSKKLK